MSLRRRRFAYTPLKKLSDTNWLVKRKYYFPEMLSHSINTSIFRLLSKLKGFLPCIIKILVGVIAEFKNSWLQFMPEVRGMFPMKCFHNFVGTVVIRQMNKPITPRICSMRLHKKQGHKFSTRFKFNTMSKVSL